MIPGDKTPETSDFLRANSSRKCASFWGIMTINVFVSRFHKCADLHKNSKLRAVLYTFLYFSVLPFLVFLL